MQIVINKDVQAVAEFMQANVPVNRLLSVAAGLNVIAPILWGKYEKEGIDTLLLCSDPIVACDQHKPLDASE